MNITTGAFAACEGKFPVTAGWMRLHIGQFSLVNLDSKARRITQDDVPVFNMTIIVQTLLAPAINYFKTNVIW